MADANDNYYDSFMDPDANFDPYVDADAEAEDESFDASHVNANAYNVGGGESEESEEEGESAEASIARLPYSWEELAINPATQTGMSPVAAWNQKESGFETLEERQRRMYTTPATASYTTVIWSSDGKQSAVYQPRPTAAGYQVPGTAAGRIVEGPYSPFTSRKLASQQQTPSVPWLHAAAAAKPMAVDPRLSKFSPVALPQTYGSSSQNTTAGSSRPQQTAGVETMSENAKGKQKDVDEPRPATAIKSQPVAESSKATKEEDGDDVDNEQPKKRRTKVYGKEPRNLKLHTAMTESPASSRTEDRPPTNSSMATTSSTESQPPVAVASSSGASNNTGSRPLLGGYLMAHLQGKSANSKVVTTAVRGIDNFNASVTNTNTEMPDIPIDPLLLTTPATVDENMDVQDNQMADMETRGPENGETGTHDTEMADAPEETVQSHSAVTGENPTPAGENAESQPTASNIFTNFSFGAGFAFGSSLPVSTASSASGNPTGGSMLLDASLFKKTATTATGTSRVSKVGQKQRSRSPVKLNSHPDRLRTAPAPAPTPAPIRGFAPAPAPTTAPILGLAPAPAPIPSLAPAHTPAHTPTPAAIPASALAPAPAPTPAHILTPTPITAPALDPTPAPAHILAPISMTSAPIAAPVPALTPASVIAQATSVDTATQTGIEHHKLLHEKEDFVQRLQRENEELKEATAMAGSRADLLENDLKQSRLDNDKLREAAAAAKSKADRLEDTVKKSRLENNRLREAAATAKSRADRLQDNATQSQARSTELEKENKTLQGTTKSQDAEIKALRDALARKDKTLADHARNAEGHARKIRELESLKAAECENCKRLSRDLEQMRRQRDEERHKTQEVESELAVEKRQSTHAAYIAVVKYSDLSSEKVKLESSNRQLKIQYDHMRGKVDELSEEKLRNDRQREDDAYKKAETAIRKKLEDAHKEQLAQLKQEHQQKLAERTQALLFWERNTTKMIDRKRAEDQAEIARLERKIYGLNHQLGRENENWVDLYNQRRAADKALKATQEELKATQKNVEDVRRKCLTEHPTPAQKAVQLGSRFVAFVTRKKEACMYRMTLKKESFMYGMAPYQRIFWAIFWAIIGKIEPYVAPLLALVAVFSLGFFVVLVKIVEDLFEFLKDPNAFSTSDENLDAASSTAQYQVQV